MLAIIKIIDSHGPGPSFNDKGLHGKRLYLRTRKKFNLDGADGVQHCWHDIRNKYEMFSRRVNGRRSFMIRRSISYHDLLDMVRIDGA